MQIIGIVFCSLETSSFLLLGNKLNLIVTIFCFSISHIYKYLNVKNIVL